MSRSAEQNKNSFPARLRELLSRTGATQSALARAVDVQRSSVSGWLKGTYEPNKDNLQDIASFFEVSPAWLAGLESPSAKPSGYNKSSYSPDTKWRIRRAIREVRKQLDEVERLLDQ